MILLQENDTAGKVAPLTPAQAAFLGSCGLVTVRPEGSAHRLAPKSKQVGAVHAHGLDVVVQPKVTLPRLLFMVGYARNPGFRPENVQGAEADGLWAIVAETLCRNVERALVHGVLLGYTTEQAASTVVRGRIRVGDQIARRPGQAVPVEVTHDDFTADIPENRILRSAVRRTLGVPRVDPEVVRRLRHLDRRLEGAEPLAAGAPVPKWRPHRLNRRYHAALRIAELVLDTMSFEVGEGGLSIAAFVVDMWKVFEDFVTTALAEAWKSGPGRTEGQFPVPLDAGGAITMTVDAVHFVDGAPKFVVDAKYKLESRTGRYPVQDLYQVLAYCTALRVDRGWLVYPSGTAGVTPRRIRHSPITITEYPLDLDVPAEELLAQVERLAQSAWT